MSVCCRFIFHYIMNDLYRDNKKRLDGMYWNWVDWENWTIWYLENKKPMHNWTESWKLYRVLEKEWDICRVLTDWQKMIWHSEDWTEWTAWYELVNRMFLLLVKYDNS